MTSESPDDGGQVRLAELVAALSLGVDLGFGQPMEHVLRQCLIALRLAERADLDEAERVAVYYTALLVNVGCHSDAHEQAKWFGDDVALKSGKYEHEQRSLAGAAAAIRLIGSGNPPLHRFRVGLEFALVGFRELDGMIASHSALARTLAGQLGLPDAVQQAVGAFGQPQGDQALPQHVLHRLPEPEVHAQGQRRDQLSEADLSARMSWILAGHHPYFTCPLPTMGIAGSGDAGRVCVPRPGPRPLDHRGGVAGWRYRPRCARCRRDRAARWWRPRPRCWLPPSSAARRGRRGRRASLPGGGQPMNAAPCWIERSWLNPASGPVICVRRPVIEATFPL